MNLADVMSQLVSLFLMMFVGYVVARVGIMTPDFRARLSHFTLSAVAPCAILSAVLESDATPSMMLSAVGVSFVFYIFQVIFAAALVRIVPSKKEERGWDQLMLIFTNVGFMGIPVIQSIYGVDGVARLSMFILMFNLFFFSYGMLLIASGEKINFKAMLNPCIAAALLGLICGTTGLHFPAVIEKTMSSIGAMNTPLAMMIIGSSVAHSDIVSALRNPRLYRVSGLSMIAMPLLTLGVMLFLPIDPILKGISVLLAAMPIAGNCSMIANIYAPGDMSTSHATIVSTLSSAATLPVICALLTMILS